MNEKSKIKSEVYEGLANGDGFYIPRSTGVALERREIFKETRDWESHEENFFKRFMKASPFAFWVHEKKWLTPTDVYYFQVLMDEAVPMYGAAKIDFSCLEKYVSKTRVKMYRSKLRKIGLVEKVDGVWFINPSLFGYGGGTKKSFKNKFKQL
jgi:hypothetical protein